MTQVGFLNAGSGEHMSANKRVHNRLHIRVSVNELEQYKNIMAEQGFQSLSQLMRYGALLAGERKTKSNSLLKKAS